MIFTTTVTNTNSIYDLLLYHYIRLQSLRGSPTSDHRFCVLANYRDSIQRELVLVTLPSFTLNDSESEADPRSLTSHTRKESEENTGNTDATNPLPPSDKSEIKISTISRESNGFSSPPTPSTSAHPTRFSASSHVGRALSNSDSSSPLSLPSPALYGDLARLRWVATAVEEEVGSIVDRIAGSILANRYLDGSIDGGNECAANEVRGVGGNSTRGMGRVRDKAVGCSVSGVEVAESSGCSMLPPDSTGYWSVLPTIVEALYAFVLGYSQQPQGMNSFETINTHYTQTTGSFSMKYSQEKFTLEDDNNGLEKLLKGVDVLLVCHDSSGYPNSISNLSADKNSVDSISFDLDPKSMNYPIWGKQTHFLRVLAGNSCILAARSPVLRKILNDSRQTVSIT